ncbi:MAG TPA: ABC transporter permease subunit [Casimicrobiaceae bacterium]|jgi:general L-amino acid transport system permease protein
MATVRDRMIEPRCAPVVGLPLHARWQRLLFPTPPMSLLSMLLVAAIAWLAWRFVQWAILDAHWSGSTSDACPPDGGACWAFLAARWRPWLVGGYPADQLWRAWLVFATFIAYWIWLTRRPPGPATARALWGFVLLPVVLFLILFGGGPLSVVPPTRWGGLLLTLVATLATFATALPLGLLLALGRRSRLPIVCTLSAAFVETMRSVPLLVVLFIAATLLPLLLPSGWNVDLFARALGAFALFNAALAAEVFRGGLQTVGHGQLEAATTVGLSDFAALRLVVLPQAITAVVPALVNIMIAVIKETTLLSVIGVNDLLGAVENGAKSPEWMGDANILTSGQVFLAMVYLAVCYGLSRYSRRLEARR